MFREEGSGGVEEGSRVTCVENSDMYLMDCFHHFGISTNLPQ